MTRPVLALAQRATVRLIPAAHHKPAVLQALVDTPEELAALEHLEGLTNERLRAQKQGLPDLDPRELAFRSRAAALNRWGWTYVNAAFLYTRPTGNRFNGPERGAWYCAFDDLTAVEEVAFHRTRELLHTNELTDHALYQAYLADFIGDFPVLRHEDPTPPSLHPDPAKGYPAGQALAAQLRAEGYSGLIYDSVRRPGGTCFVAFEPQIVQNVRPGARWALAWTGSIHFTATAA